MKSPGSADHANHSAIEAVLRKAALFAALSDDEMNGLLRRVSSRRFARGEILFHEGDPCRGLFLVARGKIRIF